MDRKISPGTKKEKLPFSWILARPVTFGFAIFIIITALIGVIIYQRYQKIELEEQQHLSQMLSSTKSRLQLSLDQGLLSTQSLAFIIKKDGLSMNFDSAASRLLSYNHYIDALQLVPGGVIRYVFPVEGNESVIGYNILTDTLRNTEAFKSIEKKRIFFAGPLQLRQGGVGIVGRLPVFIEDKFWGFAAVVIKLNTLLKAAGIDTTGSSGYYFQLTKINPETGKEETFLPEHPKSGNHTASVLVPDGEWKLSVRMVEVNAAFWKVFPGILLGFLLSMLTAWLAYFLAKRPAELESIVAEKSQQLEKNSKRNAAIVSGITDTLFIVDQEGRFTDYNNPYGSSTFMIPENFIGEKITEVMPADPGLKLLKNVQRVLQSKEALTEAYHLDIHGNTNYYEATYSPITEKEALVIVKDITSRIKAENAVKKTQENLWQVLNSISDIFYVVDTEYRIILLNDIAKQSLAKAWGVSLEVGTTILHHLPDEKDEPVLESFQKAFKGEPVEYELPLSFSGLPAWVLVAYSPVKDNEGHITGVAIITKDISQRKKAEEGLMDSYRRLELIGRTTNDAVWEWDLVSGKLWSNETHQHLYGLTLADPVPDVTEWVKRIHPDDRDEVLSVQERILQSAENIFISEYRFLTQHDEYRDLYDRCYIIRDKNGTAVKMVGSMMDITERKRAQEAIRTNEETQRLIMNSALDAIVCINLQGNITVWTPQAEKIFLWKEAEVLGKDLTETIIPPAYRKDHLSGMERFRQSGEYKVLNKLIELSALNKNGIEFPVELSIIPVSQGATQFFCAFIRDITERKKAEQELKHNEEKYRTLVEQAADAIALYDAEGKILDVNTGSVNLLGYTKDELMQMSIPDILTRNEIAEKPVRYDLLKKGESTVKQRLMQKKNGGIIQAEVRSQQLPDGRFLSIIRDLTERIKAQQQIEREKALSDKLIDSLPGVFYWYDEHGRFLRWNKQLEIVTGYTGEEISKIHPTQFFEGEGKAHIIERIEKVFREGEGDAEADFVAKDGSKHPYFFKAIRVNFDGKPCLLGTGIDISDRVKAEKELEASYESVRRLTEHLQKIREEERAHIAREIHDELGQQLTVIKMDVSWLNKRTSKLDDEPMKNKMKELLTTLDETVKSIRRISSELRPSVLDDLGLVAAMEWQLQEFEKRSGIHTTFVTAEQEVDLSDLIKTALFRILQESLTNVARHSLAKNLKVSLEQKNDNFVLTIADDGKGFDLEKVAEKRTLGILGMNERTSMIGGSYKITSAPQKGTTISVTVPVIAQKE